MITFKEYILAESYIAGLDFSKHAPSHSYKTADGHDINVHVFQSPHGHTAIFHNTSLGKHAVTKVVHWAGTSPSNKDLELIGKDELNEFVNDKVDADTAGKLAEHSAVIRMAHHLHTQNGTVGSDEHKKLIAAHHEAINKLSAGKNEDQVALRIKHGEAQADASLAHLKAKHGDGVHLTAVGHTSKAGDIGRFTKGKHNDSQENPSDIAVAFKKNKKAKDEHYEGYSLKSSAKSSVITAKNPAIHMDHLLDTKDRKFKGEEISRAGLQEVRKKAGHEGKSAADMGRHIDATRHAEGVKALSSVEVKANAVAGQVKHEIVKEFHDHVHHILHNTVGGHQQIGHLLKSHLTAETSMPWSKTHAKGDTVAKTHASVSDGSESHLNHIFADKKTKYHVSHKGERTTISYVHPKTGEHVPLAHYSPKTKSNALKSDVHGWNVVPASKH